MDVVPAKHTLNGDCMLYDEITLMYFTSGKTLVIIRVGTTMNYKYRLFQYQKNSSSV